MDETFSGGVFSDTLDNGRAGGDIVMTPSSVKATTPDGQVFEIPLRECQIEIGGFNGRMVFCRPPDRSLTIFCDHKRFPAALSTASSGTLDAQLGSAKRKVRGANRRQFWIGIGSIAAILLILVGCFFAVQVGARAAVHGLPVSVDRKLGEAAFSTMDLGGPKVEDEVVLSAMRTIVRRLEPHAAIADLDFELHVVDSPQMNAFCLPGGIIVVYTGLIENAANADQVASVVGHEMAHATLRHGLERTSQSLGLGAAVALIIGDAGGLIAAGADLFQYAAVNSYSREQEEAADAEGVRMLHAARIDPAAMSQFFQALEDEHGDVPGLLAWISTHPQHAQRIANVERLVDGLATENYRPIDVDWEQVQSHVRQLGQRP